MFRNAMICAVLMLCGAWPSFASGIEELVDAEFRFAEAAATDGMRDAFLGVLSEDGVLFRPLPVNGREWFEAAPATPGVLGWKPVFAEISGNGDLGYTTGPWRLELEGRPPIFGHYVSIWRSEDGDPWQLVLDVGISHGQPEAAAWEPAIAPEASGERAKALRKGRRGQLEEALLETDREFLAVAGEKGLAEAYRQDSSDQIRFYRNGHLPVVGLVAVLEALDDTAGPRSGEAVAAHVARSGEIGYTYGIGRFVQEDEDVRENGYLRIWRRSEDGAWKIVLDVLSAAP
jgi:ketosteroid isomerase-like protein